MVSANVTNQAERSSLTLIIGTLPLPKCRVVNHTISPSARDRYSSFNRLGNIFFSSSDGRNWQLHLAAGHQSGVGSLLAGVHRPRRGLALLPRQGCN